MTLTVIMTEGSGTEIVTRHPTGTSASNAGLDPVRGGTVASLSLHECNLKIRGI